MQTNTSLRDKLNDAAGWIMAASAFVAVIAITALMTSMENAIAAGLIFVGLLLGGFLSIAAHELGHAAGAWLVGWRVWIISVLGVVIRPGHRLRLSTKYHQDVGGYVLASAPNTQLDSKWRRIVFTAGGPLVSLVTGPIFAYWLITTPNDAWQTPLGAAVFTALLAFAIASASAALATLWPMRGRHGRPNDMGMIIGTLFSRNPSADIRGAAWAWALFEHGVEPSEWPPWMQEAVARSAVNPWASPTAPLLAFLVALDRNDENAARVAAKRSTHDAGKLMRAFVAAFFDRDVEVAKTEIADAAITSEDTVALLYDFVAMKIKALSGEAEAASRARARLFRDIRNDVPRPFWDQMFERYAS